MLKDDLIKGAREASLYIGIKPRSVYSLCEKGAIPFARVGGGLYFRKSELDLTFTGSRPADHDAPELRGGR